MVELKPSEWIDERAHELFSNVGARSIAIEHADIFMKECQYQATKDFLDTFFTKV